MVRRRINRLDDGTLIEPVKTESELCSRFIETQSKYGWEAFPEHADWDIVLVKDGVTFGIEAKLSPNFTTTAQVMKRVNRSRPDFIGILTPRVRNGMIATCHHLGICVMGPETFGECLTQYGVKLPPREVYPTVAAPDGRAMKLPKYQPGSIVVPGAPSPRSLTPWRIKAILLCHILRTRGYVTSRDFGSLTMNVGTWVDRWIVADGKVGRLKRYVPKSEVPLPDEGGWNVDGIVGSNDEKLKKILAENP